MSSAALPVRVAHKQLAAQDICVFDLVAADGGALPPFEAGAHIDVQLPEGLTRQYSLCNRPGETTHYQIGVLREPNSRGGSRAMHEQVQVGQLLQISAPRNHFALAPQAPQSLLLAGGIGITPLLAMAESLAAAGAGFALHYCTRARSRTAFLDRLATAPWAGRVALHFDDEAPAQRLDSAAVLAAAPAGTHLYVCGPRGFIEAMLAAARQQAWPEDRLHCEYFAGQVPASTGDTGFELEARRSGRTLQVPAGVSIIQVLAEAGIPVMTSCEQGVCGTCLTPVLEGVPEHRDSYLTAEEQAANDQMLPCCSRARSARLVLDL